MAVARWEFYECSVDEKRAFIWVDLDLHSVAPIASLPWSLRVTLPLLDPRDDGLNTAAERPALDAIEDGLEAAFAAEGARFVGRTTYGGERRHYFYGSSLDCLETALDRARATVVDRPLEGDGFEDPQWRQYFDFLYPNDLAWVYITDSRVLEALRRDGDDGKQARKIDHFAYFPREEDRGAFAVRVKAEGLSVDGVDESEGSERPFALFFSHEGAPVEIFPVTLRLHRFASELGGRYDGWECPVLTPVERPTDGSGRAD